MFENNDHEPDQTNQEATEVEKGKKRVREPYDGRFDSITQEDIDELGLSEKDVKYYQDLMKADVNVGRIEDPGSKGSVWEGGNEATDYHSLGRNGRRRIE
jgi:hypothetical protein